MGDYFDDLKTIDELVLELESATLGRLLYKRYMWAADNTEQSTDYLEKALKLQVKFRERHRRWTSNRQITSTRERLRALKSITVEQ